MSEETDRDRQSKRILKKFFVVVVFVEGRMQLFNNQHGRNDVFE